MNNFGISWHNLCKTYSLLLCSGRIGEDKGIGNFTFVGPTGNSVIYLIICSKEVLHLTESFTVEERTQSSHFPVSISLQCYINSAVLKNILFHRHLIKLYTILIWRTDELRNNLASQLTNEFIYFFTLQVEDNAKSIIVLTVPL